jgi:hypothetical protein
MDAFFTSAASIRDTGGVMVNEYQSYSDFKNWRDQAFQKLEVDFPYEFWVKKTRHRIIHLIGNIGYETRRLVVAEFPIITKEDGSMWITRHDPPADNRWRFAQDFDPIEGGKVIVDRCKEYRKALTQMVDDWENNHPITTGKAS